MAVFFKGAFSQDLHLHILVMLNDVQEPLICTSRYICLQKLGQRKEGKRSARHIALDLPSLEGWLVYEDPL
jgi:hypothetical protein